MMIKAGVGAIVVLMLTSPAGANGLCNTADLLSGVPLDPKIVMSTRVHFTRADLPEGVYRTMEKRLLEIRDPPAPGPWSERYRSYQPPDERHLPPSTSFDGSQMDLNQDGIEEYFLVNTTASGRGGDVVYIISSAAGDWLEVGEYFGYFVGALSTGTTHQNLTWRDFAVSYRFGGDAYTWTVYSFNGNRYVATRAAQCDKGVVKGWTDVRP